MKKFIFIIVVLFVLIAYCAGSAKNFGYIQIPQYAETQINVLGEMSPEQWQTNEVARDERIKELTRAEYQPDKDGFNFGGNHSYEGSQTLTAEDYKRIVEKEPNHAKDLSVRDPAEVIALANMGYIVRDNVYGSNGKIIASAGEILDKATLDNLISDGVKKIRVVGTGGVVSIESGTMLMVPLIFLALLCALKIVMFDPLVKIMDERSTEIAEGTDQAKKNRIESAKLAKESKENFEQLRREHVIALGKAKHKIILESESVIHEANAEAHKIREEAHRELQATLAKVEDELRNKVDELARDIVAQVVSGDKA